MRARAGSARTPTARDRRTSRVSWWPSGSPARWPWVWARVGSARTAAIWERAASKSRRSGRSARMSISAMPVAGSGECSRACREWRASRRACSASSGCSRSMVSSISRDRVIGPTRRAAWVRGSVRRVSRWAATSAGRPTVCWAIRRARHAGSAADWTSAQTRGSRCRISRASWISPVPVSWDIPSARPSSAGASQATAGSWSSSKAGSSSGPAGCRSAHSQARRRISASTWSASRRSSRTSASTSPGVCGPDSTPAGPLSTPTGVAAERGETMPPY